MNLNSSGSNGLEKTFQKSLNDLEIAKRNLNLIFSRELKVDNDKTREQLDPVSLLSRLNKLEKEIPLLQKQCSSILDTERETIFLSKYILLNNRRIIEQMYKLIQANNMKNAQDLKILNLQNTLYKNDEQKTEKLMIQMEKEFEKQYDQFWVKTYDKQVREVQQIQEDKTVEISTCSETSPNTAQ